MITNNDIIRRIRYIFDFSDTNMIEIFGLAGHKVTRAQISDWLKKEDDPDSVFIPDLQLAIFLNGLIILKRGKKDGEPPAVPEKQLNNNVVLRKLKIALHSKDIDMLKTLELAGMRISKHELSALFRNPTQVQYRECNDQLLRNFLKGLQINYNK